MREKNLWEKGCANGKISGCEDEDQKQSRFGMERRFL
jgi:hypothetical protein